MPQKAGAPKALAGRRTAGLWRAGAIAVIRTFEPSLQVLARTRFSKASGLVAPTCIQAVMDF